MRSRQKTTKMDKLTPEQRLAQAFLIMLGYNEGASAEQADKELEKLYNKK